MTKIITERLVLRKTINLPSHLKIMADWLNDPENVRYSEQRHKKHDEESQLTYLANGPDIFREIHLRHSSFQLIGTISAYTDRNNSVADVGILIGKEHWGKGYGYEAWSTFCDHLLNNGIRKIEAGCMGLNIPMRGIFNKYGMIQEGFREQHFLHEGILIGMSLWGKFK